MDRHLRRALVYAQDNLGLGHINRTLTVTRHLLARQPELVVYIATKSAIGSSFHLPPRCDYIKLPARITPQDVARTEDEREADRRQFRDLRSRLLRDVALGLAPDLVIVDHEPLGHAGEFRDGLYALKQARPATRFVFGMRDITDDPARTRSQWRELGVYDALVDLYDGIAVYGSRALFDVATAYALPPAAAARLRYCGFVLRDMPDAPAASIRRELCVPEEAEFVVAAVGSGSDGFPVLAATLDALARIAPRHPRLEAVLVAGPFMPAEQRATLEARAGARFRVLESADTFRLMGAADAIVTMGGYNSVSEAIATGRPLVVIPRETHKVEQFMRAEVLARHGLAHCVRPAALANGALAQALECALETDKDAQARRARAVVPSLDGAAALAAYVESLP